MASSSATGRLHTLEQRLDRRIEAREDAAGAHSRLESTEAALERCPSAGRPWHRRGDGEGRAGPWPSAADVDFVSPAPAGKLESPTRPPPSASESSAPCRRVGAGAVLSGACAVRRTMRIGTHTRATCRGPADAEDSTRELRYASRSLIGPSRDLQRRFAMILPRTRLGLDPPRRAGRRRPSIRHVRRPMKRYARPRRARGRRGDNAPAAATGTPTAAASGTVLAALTASPRPARCPAAALSSARCRP